MRPWYLTTLSPLAQNGLKGNNFKKICVSLQLKKTNKITCNNYLLLLPSRSFSEHHQKWKSIFQRGSRWADLSQAVHISIIQAQDGTEGPSFAICPATTLHQSAPSLSISHLGAAFYFMEAVLPHSILTNYTLPSTIKSYLIASLWNVCPPQMWGQGLLHPAGTLINCRHILLSRLQV